MIVVGAGRVGAALAERGADRGAPCTLIDRERNWEALDGDPGVPILLAVRNDDLLDVLSRVPHHRRDDVVFLQNGMIRPFLRDNGLEQCTRGLLYLAVARRGDAIIGGGINWFTGPHGRAVAGWFTRLGLEARDVDWPRFTYYELEKLCWLSILGPLCELHGETVGQVAEHRADEIEALADELRSVGRAALGVDAPLEHLVGRLVGYSLRIPDFRASVKEWPWRNGWFEAAARRYGVPTPRHREILAQVGKGHLLEGVPQAGSAS